MKRPLFLSFFISAALLSTAWLGRDAVQHSFAKLFDIARLVRAEYVDDVKDSSLLDGALSGMLKSLDPYSQYLDAQTYADLKADTEGKFGGVGVEVGMRGGHLQVISALEDSPAERAGILTGDIILKINGEPTHEMNLSESTRRMRGEAGSVVKLTLLRERENKILEVGVLRDQIHAKSIKEAKILEGRIAYARIVFFQEDTADELEKAIEQLIKEGADTLILDVRNNSGGLFLEAVKVAGLFIPKDEVVVSTKGRQPKKNHVFKSASGQYAGRFKMAVLTNKGSASGSEILAGALQDHKIAQIIGMKTYGKGSVQTLTPLADGTAIRMTTSRYYTPSGKLIHEIGVTPDVVVEDEKTPQIDPVLEKAIECVS